MSTRLDLLPFWMPSWPRPGQKFRNRNRLVYITDRHSVEPLARSGAICRAIWRARVMPKVNNAHATEITCTSAYTEHLQILCTRPQLLNAPKIFEVPPFLQSCRPQPSALNLLNLITHYALPTTTTLNRVSTGNAIPSNQNPPFNAALPSILRLAILTLNDPPQPPALDILCAKFCHGLACTLQALCSCRVDAVLVLQALCSASSMEPLSLWSRWPLAALCGRTQTWICR